MPTVTSEARALTSHSFTTLMRRLARAGFKGDFVSLAVLPDWWQADCVNDPTLLSDIEVRVARFLKAPLASIRDPKATLAPPSYAGAQLRRVRNIDRDRLAPAIHAAIQVAAAVVRSLREPRADVRVPPPDALQWRSEIRHPDAPVKLRDVLTDCWKRGIPIVPMEVLPSPSFQGLACIVEGRPVVVLGHKHDEPGRVASLVAHEIGHVVAGDCEPEQPVVDEEETADDATDMERLADQYAAKLLVGDTLIPDAAATNPKELASTAAAIEREHGVDAGAVIWSWARKTGIYADAVTALKALYRANGARRLVREHFLRFVDLDSATESDRALLRSVLGDSDHDDAAAD